MYISELYMWILCPERPIGEDTFMSFMWSCNGKRSSICKINRDKNAIQYGKNYRNLRPSRTFKQKADAAGRASPLGLRSSRKLTKKKKYITNLCSSVASYKKQSRMRGKGVEPLNHC